MPLDGFQQNPGARHALIAFLGTWVGQPALIRKWWSHHGCVWSDNCQELADLGAVRAVVRLSNTLSRRQPWGDDRKSYPTTFGV